MMTREPPAEASPADRVPWMFILAAAIAFLGTVHWLAGGMWVNFLHQLILEGAFVTGWLLGAVGYGCLFLRLLKLKPESRAMNFATAAGLGLGLIGILVLLLGLIGWLNRASAIVIVAVGWLGYLAKSKQAYESRRWERANWWWLLVAPLLAIVLVGVFELPGLLWQDEPLAYDVLAYHLQIPREWFELGRIVPLEHNVFSYFPFNVETHYLLAMHLRGGPWAGMYLAQLMHAVFVGLTVVAVYGAIRQTIPRTAVIAAVLTACTPWLIMLSPVAYNEGGLMFFTTLSVAWMLQSARALTSQSTSGAGGSELRSKAISGIFAGLACGTKLTAVPMLLLAMPFVLDFYSRRARTYFTGFLFCGLLSFSPWLIRNIAWSGNPVFPQGMMMFGRGHFSIEQAQRWMAAHDPAPTDRSPAQRVAAAGREIVRNFRYGYVLLPLALVAAILAIRKPAVRMLTALLVIQFLIWIAATHLQGRFFVTAIPLAAMLIAQVEAAAWRWICGLAAIALTCINLTGPGREIKELDFPLGESDFKPVLSSVFPPDVASRIFDENRPVTLVGEARAFSYPIPMSRLRYRSIFDVKDAWIEDGDLVTDGVLLVNPQEIIRLHKTYIKLPEFPQYIVDYPSPFILPPERRF